MEIRSADIADRPTIVKLSERSQDATKIPSPAIIPRSELGSRLYARQAFERYVAIELGEIVGHIMIEIPNQIHIASWRETIGDDDVELIEIGGAFVEPTRFRQGIFTGMLGHSLDAIRKRQAVPVSVTWLQNEHVKKTFKLNGGIEAGLHTSSDGDLSLFVFPML